MPERIITVRVLPSQAVARYPLTVTMPRELYYALLRAVAYPPLKRNQYASSAGVPWTRIEEIRKMLDDLGVDWREIHRQIYPYEGR